MWVKMNRIAVFVDAGYLFAQGAVALSGSKRPRSQMKLDARTAVAQLKDLALAKAPNCELLRIYWYDGAIASSKPTAEQALLANLDNVKLRLGFVNSNGEQKGVDSLIVTDLIELGRQKSICDALLLSGDEDVRIGVQIAQNYGVRVHLLGIEPSRGSQSSQLIQEADTTSEWTRETVRSFLFLPVEIDQLEARILSSQILEHDPSASDTLHLNIEETIHNAVGEFVSKLEKTDFIAIEIYWKTDRGIPVEYDRRLLPICRDAIGRNLEREEIKIMRRHFQRTVKSKMQ